MYYHVPKTFVFRTKGPGSRCHSKNSPKCSTRMHDDMPMLTPAISRISYEQLGFPWGCPCVPSHASALTAAQSKEPSASDAPSLASVPATGCPHCSSHTKQSPVCMAHMICGHCMAVATAPRVTIPRPSTIAIQDSRHSFCEGTATDQ